ncbi:hypothetical protein [Actinomyces minihominis]|uniref:hypothetical protein n=1 Tax=Actinomyces minihominis TaxID=2002838 RepID=UPI00101AD9A7|nr:hypothetical protein [Actinomyces minihominis]
MAMQLRLHPDEDAMLEEIAKNLGLSKNQTVATLVRGEWEAQQSRTVTDNLLDSISARRKNLLERLAQ